MDFAVTVDTIVYFSKTNSKVTVLRNCFERKDYCFFASYCIHYCFSKTWVFCDHFYIFCTVYVDFYKRIEKYVLVAAIILR